MTNNELLALKREVDEAKDSIAEMKGHQKALMNQLKETWACKTIEEAQNTLLQLKKQIEDLDESIEAKTLELETKYDV